MAVQKRATSGFSPSGRIASPACTRALNVRDAGAAGSAKMLTQGDLDRIIFGCGNFGGIGSSPKLREAGDTEQQALQLLDHARRVGLRRFDTANTYGGGASEIVLGQWLRSQGASFLK